MNKPRYQKPQAVKDLERQALDHFRREHPDFPEYAIPPQPYRDNTANGLTKCIVDYIRYNGGQAERINTTGMPEQRGGQIVWRKSNATKGSADISATIAGRSVKIEVKIGLDRQVRRSAAIKQPSNGQVAYTSLPKISHPSLSGTVKHSTGHSYGDS